MARKNVYEGAFATNMGLTFLGLSAVLPLMAFGITIFDETYTMDKFLNAPGFPISYGLATLGLAFTVGGLATAATSKPIRN